MKNLIIILVLLSLSFTTSGQPAYKIQGRAFGQNGQQVMLFTFKNQKVNSVDTTHIFQDTFLFEGNKFSDEFAVITTGNYLDTVKSVKFILEPGSINVRMDTETSVTGTHLNDEYQNFLDGRTSYANIKNTLKEKIKLKESMSDADSVMYYRKELGILEIGRESIIKTFIVDNLDNALGKELFRYYMRNLSYEDFMEIYFLLDKQTQKESKVVKVLKKQESSQKLKNNKFQLLGTKYQDYTLITTEGKEIKLSDYIGKSEYLFIDFWASWCGPCIADMPNLKKVYEKYKDIGLEVVGISLDSNESNWKRGLKRINVPWNQLLIPVDSQSKLKEAYRFKGIPYGVLIDKKGIIRNVNLNGALLDNYLEKLLKK